MLTVEEDGRRGPRPHPAAVWDGDQGGWRHEADELVVTLRGQYDVAGYAFASDGEVFGIHAGDFGPAPELTRSSATWMRRPAG
ncbi:hypothetical protein [Egicoccus sp. AB-alg2]|uniref:hypothetical protein n=1 Tax=Egicoccus sp. AB-alg2 TaxID=3242693 RepID=UPI00359DD2D5